MIFFNRPLFFFEISSIVFHSKTLFGMRFYKYEIFTNVALFFHHVRYHRVTDMMERWRNGSKNAVFINYHDEKRIKP